MQNRKWIVFSLFCFLCFFFLSLLFQIFALNFEKQIKFNCSYFLFGNYLFSTEESIIKTQIELKWKEGREIWFVFMHIKLGLCDVTHPTNDCPPILTSVTFFRLVNVHSSLAIILMRKRELVALLRLSSLCLVMFVWLFLAVPWVCLHFAIVVFPTQTHLLFLIWIVACCII